MVDLSRREPDPAVRSQLGLDRQETARRRRPSHRPGTSSCASEDADDPHLPLLLWWALEDKAVTHRDQVLELFKDRDLWKAPLVARHILERLARRYAAHPTAENQTALARLLESPADGPARGLARRASRRRIAVARSTASSRRSRRPSAAGQETDPTALALAVRGDARATAAVLAVLTQDDTQAPDQHLELMDALADARAAEAIPVLLEVLARSKSGRRPGSRPSPPSAGSTTRRWPRGSWRAGPASTATCAAGRWTSCAGKSWTRTLLHEAVGNGTIPRRDIADDVLESGFRLLGDRDLTGLVDRYSAGRCGQPRRRSSSRSTTWRPCSGSAAGTSGRGKPLYTARCATCHKLFGEGGIAGPELTGYERTNLENLIPAVVDPSAVIREGFGQHLGGRPRTAAAWWGSSPSATRRG